ncbi:MAG: zinc ribbon domain-containing protein [Candidatus Eisenbacteria bacterium]|uniref:Zinc ribbon domain-containing protein n=1 Tax=Eiseniibacteriota bacterium TaxID=2212470 RepID=A0A956M0L5_UNCEI|nr:zinc ribbon domain-containing protein [Candidatus Eisenbacteria bacterium]
MPFYEYHCPGCGQPFTLLRPMAERDQPAECPQCGQVTDTRELSTFATSGSGTGGSAPSFGGGCSSGFS